MGEEGNSISGKSQERLHPDPHRSEPPYLPMQKLLNTTSSTSSMSTCPMTSPSAWRASRASRAVNSGASARSRDSRQASRLAAQRSKQICGAR